jgi:thioredoxin-like negative regulator of GroEL
MLAMLGEIKSQVTGGRSQDYPLAGQSLPPNPVSDTEGKLTDTTIALAAHPSSLVIFSRAECRFCDQLLEQLEELVREESWSPAIVFIWLGQIDEASIQRAGKLATDQYVDSSERIAADLLVQGTPSAIKIIDGRLGNVMALGPDEVLQLARSSLVDG